MSSVISFVPRTPANVVRSLAARHPEIETEALVVAERLDDALRGPLDSNKLRVINMCWARGQAYCKSYKDDVNPLSMP